MVLSDVHPADQLQLHYSHWFEMPPRPHHALHRESLNAEIRENTTVAERLEAWARIERLPAPISRRVK